jgi:hypothetical protein
MRSLSRWVPLATLAATLALMAALPAQARPTAPATTTAATTTVCDRAVCESVLGVGFTVQSVKASARTPAQTRCGHFAMTIRTPNTVTLTNSPPICGSQPSYVFVVRKTFPAGTTIAMQFVSNPPTPGRPVVRLPLR